MAAVPGVCAKCGIEGSLRCSRCKSVRYCTKECQVSHWPVHKSVCSRPKKTPATSKEATWNAIAAAVSSQAEAPPVVGSCVEGALAVRPAEGKGRGAFAARSFGAGDVLFAEEPFVSCCTAILEQVDAGCRRLSPREADLEQKADACCHMCLKPAPFMHPVTRVLQEGVRCSDCRLRYCSKECLTLGLASGHWLICPPRLGTTARKSLQRLTARCARQSRMYPLLVLRCVAKLLSGQAAGAATGWSKLQHIYAPDVNADGGVPHVFAEELMDLNAIFADYVDDVGMIVYLRMCAMLKANCISVKTIRVALASDAGRAEEVAAQSEGMGLFVYGSMLNHSCVPNVEIRRTLGHVTQFVAKRDISEGEEVAIDYLGVAEEAGDVTGGMPLEQLDEEMGLEVVERFTERQTRMREEHNCLCKCTLCSRDAPLVRAFMRNES